MTLKEIALEILGKYHDSEISVIYEYSSTIDKDLDNLSAEIDRYTRQIETASMQDGGAGMSDDTISRLDAIDALAYFEEKSPTGRTPQEVIKALSSAELTTNLQPTCNQLATDCISILSEIRSGYSCFDSERPYYHALSEGIKALSQPERKKGKWIIHNVSYHNCHRTNRYFAECSECGMLTQEWRGNLFPPRLRFCTNCGAEMEAEHE